MDQTANSLLSSLAHLSDMCRERAHEEQRKLDKRKRRIRVDALVASNQRRRVDRARADAENRRREIERQRLEAERREHLELEARLRGQRDAEAACARIEAEHDARMREMTLVYDIERERVTFRQDRRALMMRYIAGGVAAAWLVTTVAFLANRPVPKHVFEGMATSPAAQLAAAPDVTPSASVTVDEAVEPPVVTTRTRPRRRTRARSRVPTPPPAPTESAPAPAPEATPRASCDDQVGDPCCAFGEIIC